MSDTPRTDAAICMLPPQLGWPDGRKATVHDEFVVPAKKMAELELEHQQLKAAADPLIRAIDYLNPDHLAIGAGTMANLKHLVTILKRHL